MDGVHEYCCFSDECVASGRAYVARSQGKMPHKANDGSKETRIDNINLSTDWDIVQSCNLTGGGSIFCIFVCYNA